LALLDFEKLAELKRRFTNPALLQSKALRAVVAAMVFSATLGSGLSFLLVRTAQNTQLDGLAAAAQEASKVFVDRFVELDTDVLELTSHVAEVTANVIASDASARAATLPLDGEAKAVPAIDLAWREQLEAEMLALTERRSDVVDLTYIGRFNGVPNGALMVVRLERDPLGDFVTSRVDPRPGWDSEYLRRVIQSEAATSILSQPVLLSREDAADYAVMRGANPVREADGSIVGLVLISVELTELLSQVREALGDELEALLVSDDGTSLLHPDPALSLVSGRSGSDVVGTQYPELLRVYNAQDDESAASYLGEDSASQLIRFAVGQEVSGVHLSLALAAPHAPLGLPSGARVLGIFSPGTEGEGSMAWMLGLAAIGLAGAGGGFAVYRRRAGAKADENEDAAVAAQSEQDADVDDADEAEGAEDTEEDSEAMSTQSESDAHDDDTPSEDEATESESHEDDESEESDARAEDQAEVEPPDDDSGDDSDDDQVDPHEEADTEARAEDDVAEASSDDDEAGDDQPDRDSTDETDASDEDVETDRDEDPEELAASDSDAATAEKGSEESDGEAIAASGEETDIETDTDSDQAEGLAESSKNAAQHPASPSGLESARAHSTVRNRLEDELEEARQRSLDELAVAREKFEAELAEERERAVERLVEASRRELDLQLGTSEPVTRDATCLPSSDREEFDLRQLLAQIADWMADESGGDSQSFEIRCHRDVPNRLVGDPDWIGPLLVHLGKNAVRFSDGGPVALSVGAVDDGVTGVRVCFELRAADTGLVRDVTGRVCESRPAGLALAEDIVESMHGELGVETLSGVDSTVRVIVPMSLPS
jgi:hypothetical protein